MKKSIKIILSVQCEVENQLELYYAKARGCSVKPQNKNLFDYSQLLKKNREIPQV